MAIVGPTATGKSALAVRLAKESDGEVVSADSRQVYRYMDIGTAKPTAEQRAAVRHHLIDIIDPNEDYSLALFLRQARSTISDIQARWKLPILAGGTGQYVWGLLEGWQVPNIPPHAELRRTLEARASTEGPSTLYHELAALDPQAASRVDTRNSRRVIRALEVALSRPESHNGVPSKRPPAYKVTVLGLTSDRPELDRRIDGRVDAMIAAGWVGEVEALLEAGYRLGMSSLSSLGYRELGQHLQAEKSLEEAVASIKRRTRRFARQQYTWFKPSDGRIRWFDSSPAGFDAASAEIRRLLGR